jgi:hypothetical protein
VAPSVYQPWSILMSRCLLLRLLTSYIIHHRDYGAADVEDSDDSLDIADLLLSSPPPSDYESD